MLSVTDTKSFRDFVDFTLTTTAGLSLPVTIGGRQSKLVLTNYLFGNGSVIDYSTTQVFFAGIISGRDVLFLYGRPDQTSETGVQLTGASSGSPSSDLVTISENGTIKFKRDTKGLVTVYSSSTQLILYADEETVRGFWAPMLSSSSYLDYENFWDVAQGDERQFVLVGGPYLVRDALWDAGTKTLSLRGDLNGSTEITIIGAPPKTQAITWNSNPLALSTISARNNHFKATISPSISTESFGIPKLGDWKVANSLPEIEDYDDSDWVVMNKTETTSPNKMYYGDGRVLYGCDYGL